MNAPVLLAQLSGTQTQSSSPSAKSVKIEKPQGSQAVAVHLDGQSQIDLSAIASERLTFVKLGNRLIILFDNQSTVAIDPVFDANGAPLKDAHFEVAPDRIISGDQLAELFPITTDQSVLPAAGTPGAPGVPAGANFADAKVDALTTGNPLALLAGEDIAGNTGGNTATPANPTPIPRGADVALVNEDGLSEGQPGGFGDVGGVVTSVTGSLHVDFGTDVIGRAFQFAVSQPGLAGLTSGGQEVHFTITTVNGQPELIGFIGNDPSNAASHVFTITLDANSTIEGTYTVTLLQPLDHPILGAEDTLNLTVNIIAIDGSGDTAPFTLTIGVNDDSPVAGTPEAINVGEHTGHGGPIDGPGGDYPPEHPPGEDGPSLKFEGDSFQEVTASVDLRIGWGADNGNSNVDGGSNGTVVDGDRSLVFSSAELAELQALGLTSNGETITYTISANGTEIVASVGEGDGARTIFTVSLSDTGSGSATFTLSDNIDHNGANDTSLPLTFHVVATDADGDPVNTAFTVNVADDVPSFGEKPSYSVVDEDGLPNGNPGDSYDDGNGAYEAGASVTDTLGIRWGSDDANTNVDGGITGAPVNGDRAVTFKSDVVATLEAQHLTSNGFELRYEVSANGTTLTAYRYDAAHETAVDADGKPVDTDQALVFTVSLSDVGHGSYTFALSGSLDHPTHGTEDDITLNLGFVATDSDGDAITDSFTVKVNDDAPTFGEKPSYSVVDEDGLGNAGNSYEDSNDAAGEDLTVTDTLGIQWGADSANSHVDGGLGEAPVNGDRAVTFAAEVVAGLMEQGLTSNGFGLQYEVSANGTVLSAYRTDGESYIDAEGNITTDPAAAQVFTVSLSDQGHGSYTFTLSSNLDHPQHGTEDDITLNLGFVATDSDGDAVNGSFTVVVNDDGPVFGERPTYSVVDEDGLKGGNEGDSYKGGTDVADAGTEVTDALGIQWGADSANSNVNGGITGSPVNGDRAVTFADDVVTSLEARHFTSNGEELHYVVSDDGTTLTAFNPANAAVFTVSLSDEGTGSYTFKLLGNLDHPVQGAEDDLTLHFGVVATDSDGDAVSASFTIKVNDDAPVFGEHVAYSTVDEDGLGNPGNSYSDNNDASGASLKVTDALGIRWGADSANSHVDGGITGSSVNGDRAVTFAANVVTTLEAQHLTSNGFALTYVVSADGTQLAAYRYDAAHHSYIDGDGHATTNPADAAVFTVSLSDQGTGAYTFTLIDNVDHPIRNTEDSLTLNLGYVATDSDGDAVSSSFQIRINDDAPVLNGEIATGVVDEDGLATGLAGGPNDVPGQATVANGVLGISWGADSANNLGNVGITGNAPVTGDRAVTFASDATSTLTAQHLTSNGVALTYAVSEGGTLITAYRFDGQHYIDANGNWTNSKANAAVFTVKLSDAGTGSYSFTLLDNLDHPQPNTEDNIALTLKYVATDSDGDQVSGSFKVNVNDDSPEAHTGTATSISEADINAGGGDCGPDFGGGNDASVTGALNVKWGADNNDSGAADRSVRFTNMSNAAADVHVTNGSDAPLSGLTSDGEVVKYAISNGVLVGYTGSSLAYGERVFEVSLNDDGTGSYTFKLLGNLDHPAGQGTNVIKLTFDYTAVDSDGDASSSQFTVTVVDDVPTIGHAETETVSESNLPTDGYDYSHPDGTYSTVQTGGLAISWGADDNDSGSANRAVAFNATTAPSGLTSNGYAISYVISSDGTTLNAMSSDGRKVFTVTLDDDGSGSYKFTLLDNLDHSGSGTDSLQLTFGYKATDSDGDSATSTFTVAVKDDVPTIGTAENETVSEAYLPTDGYDTSHPDAANSTVQTGSLAINWGADDNNVGSGHNRSVAFTTAAGPTGLTSDGSPISYAVSPDGTLLTATSGDGRTIFTIQLSDSGDGSYKVTLLGNIDHPASGQSDDALALSFGYKATDSDGDTATGSFKVTVLDTQPVAGAGDVKTVDEDDLANGTDTSKESTTVSGGLHVDWGADDANKTAGGGLGDRAVGFRYTTASSNIDVENSAHQNITLTSDGQAVKYALQNGVLVGYTGNDASQNHVFEVSLSDSNDGSYTFKLLGNIDHPAGNSDNIVNLTFSYTATDGDGDTSSNTFTVQVKDDVPVIGTPNGASLTENTTGPAGAEVFETQTAANVALNINWGADDGNSGTANRSVAFDGGIHTADVVKTATGATLTSNGVNVQFIRVSDTEIWGVANDNGGQLTTNDRVVFKITLSDNGSGSYSFQLLDNVDHIGSGQTNALSLKLGFTATDADGDAASSNFTVTINDDNGRPAIGTVAGAYVDEASLSGHLPSSYASSNGSLAISWGADDNNSGTVNRAVAFSGISNGQNATTDAGSLTVDGVQVKLWVVGNTLYGYTGSNPTGGNAPSNQVFKVTLDDSGTGSYSFTLLKHVDHPAGAGENDVRLTIGFTATDADGDSASSSFSVIINDDVPLATATVLKATVYESELSTGSVVKGTGSYGSDFNGDGNPNDSVFTGNLSSLVTVGADGLGSYTVEKTSLSSSLTSLTSGGVQLSYTIGADNTLIAKAGNVTIFEFQVDAATGQYSFRLKGPLDHVGTNGDELKLDLSTAVTVIDKDGDALPLHDQIIITVADDAPSSVHVSTKSVEEAAGSVSTGAVDLKVNYGADGGSLVFAGAAPKVYDSGNHQMSGLTSLGFGLQYALSSDSTTLIAYRMSGGSYIGQDGHVTSNPADAAVFTVSLSDAGTGSYNFTLLQPIDHPAATSGGQYVDVNFTFAVLDHDLDLASNDFTVRIDAAGTVTTARYDAPNSPVFINLGDTAATLGSETVAAHSVTDRAGVTDKVVGIDKLGTGITEVHGSGGDDILVGGSANETIYGGAGNDRFLYTVGDGNDTVDGGSETGTTSPNYDVLEITGDGNARNFAIGKATTGTDINPAANDGGVNTTDILVRYDGPNGATIRADEIERVVVTGGSASDTLTITDITGTAIAPSTILFNAGAGNDTLDLSRFAGNTSVVSDGGGDTDTVKLGFNFADATYTKVFATDGTTLIGVNVTHDGVTDTFTNYESFVFADGSRTLPGIFNTPPEAHDDKVATDEDTPLTINALLSLLNNDTDVDHDTMTITDVSNATHGTVSLDNGNPVFTADHNFSGVAGFDYTISDGNGGTSTAHVTVDVAPKADAPTVGFADVGPATGNEDSAITLKVMQAGVSDHDGSESLRMLITGYPQGATFSVGHAGTGDETGIWVIDDQNAIANFGTTPLQVTPPANYNGTFTLSVSVEVTDQAMLSDHLVHSDVATTQLQTIDVTVTPVNDAPEIHAPTAVTTNEDTPFTFVGQTGITFSDPDGNVGVAVTLVISGGTLDIPDMFLYGVSGHQDLYGHDIATLKTYLSTAIFTPYPDNDGSGSITITINDLGHDGSGGEKSASQTITINITPVEDAPVAVDDTASMNEDGTLIVTDPVHGVLHNDHDPDTGDSLSVIAGDYTTANGGTIHFNADGTYVYQPKANFYGTDSVDYTVRDVAGQTDTATLTITVAPVNDPPEIHAPAHVSVHQGSTIAFTGDNAITVADPDGNVDVSTSLVITGGTLDIPAHNIYGLHSSDLPFYDINTLNDYLSSAVFRPDGTGPGSITITVHDNGNVGGGDLIATQTITIDVTNDPPVAHADTNTVLEDGTVSVDAEHGVIRGTTGGSVADTDTETGTTSLVVSGVVAGTGSVTQGAGVGTSIEGAYGHLTLNADGSYSYVADKAAALGTGAQVIDTFTYTDKDPSGTVSNATTLQITVTGTDDAPVVAIAGTTGTIGDSSFAGYNAWNGSPKLWTTDWTEGGDTASSTPWNDGDIRVKTEYGTGNTYLSFSDSDNTDAYVQRTLNLKGATSATLSFDYQLRNLEQADDKILVQVSADGVNFVTVGQVGGVNYDSQTYFNISFNISSFISDHTTIRFVATAGMDYLDGSPYDSTIDLINIDNLNVSYALPPSVSYTENAAKTLVLPNLAVSDVDDTRMEQATLTLTNAQAGDRLWIGAQQLTQGSAGDVATASGTIHYTVSVTGGAIAVALSGSATSADYQTVLKSIGFDSTSENPSTVDRVVTVTVNDGELNSNTATSLIHVTEVNDKPTVSGVSAHGNEDTAIAISLAGADVDGSVASFKIATLAANGTLYSDVGLTHALSANDLVTATGNGATVYFKPAADWNGGTSFTYSAIDDRGLASAGTATASITVDPVNDAPVVAGTLAASVVEAGTHVITVAELGEADPDDSGSGLTYTVSAQSHGTILLNGSAATSFTAQDVIDGKVSFHHDGSEGASAGFSFTLADGGENGVSPASGNFAFTVSPVNDGTAALTLADTTQATTASKVGDVLQATLGADPDGAASNVVYHWKSDGNVIAGATGASYTLTSNEVGHTISVYATYTDGQGFASTTATVAQSAPVISANHAPVAHDDVFTGTSAGTPPTGDGWQYNADNGHYYKAVYGNYSFSEAVTAAAAEAPGAYLVTITSASENSFVQNMAPLYYQYSWIGASDAGHEGTWTWVTGPESGQTVTFANWNLGEPNNWGGDEDYALFTRVFGGGWNDDSGASVSPGDLSDYVGYVAEWGGTSTAPTEDKVVTISASTLLANDSDPDSGDTFTITSVQGATHGTVSLSSDHQTITFTPAANYNGDASFTYTITDSHGLSSTATVTFNLAPVNDAPSGANKTIAMVEDVSHTFTTAEFGFSDSADGDHLSGVLITTVPSTADGQLLLGNVAVTAGQIISASDIAEGMLSYAPKDNVYGNAGDATFTFQVIDDGATGGSNVNMDPSAKTMTLDMSTTNYTDTSNTGSSSTTYPDTSGYALTTSTVADQHLSISDSGGSSDRVLLNTATGGTTAFTDLEFLHSDNNLEIGWSTAGGDRSVTVLDEYVSGKAIEYFKLDDGGSYQGFSLGNADYTIASGLTGSNSNDVIAGSNASETLNGGLGNDLLFGNGGHDVLIGGKGSDLLVGGAGSDTFKWQSGDTATGTLDTIVDFETGTGGDVIDLSGLLSSVSGNRADAVRFVDSGNHTSLASANGTNVLVDGDLKLQVNTGSGWTDVATIKDTGTNLAGGHDDVIKLILDNSQAITQAHV